MTRSKQPVFKLATLAAAVAAALGVAPAAIARTLEKDAWQKLSKDVQALYVEKDGKYVLDTEGDEDVSGLKSALEKERKAAREAERLRKELEKKFEGIDADEVRRILEKIGGDEEAQLIKAGKIDEVVSKRMEKARKDMERQVKEAADKAAAAEARAQKFSQQVLDNHIRQASTKAGLHANAVDDALFRARTIFRLDEEGNAVQVDKDGQVVLGKDSKTPYSPSEWLESMKESAPHWYPAGSTGGGGQGSKQQGGVKQMKRAEFDKLDPVSRHNFVSKEKGVVVD